MKKNSQLNIALITGQHPVISETFVVNQYLGLKQKKHKVDYFCLERNNKVKHGNHGLVKANVLAWNALMPSKYSKRFFLGLRIIWVSKFHFIWIWLKSFNFLKYGKKSFNGHQFFKTYYHHFFEVNNYDVVHIHFADNAVVLVPLLKRFSKKIVVTFHGYDAHNFSSSFYNKLKKIPKITYTVNTNYTFNKVLQLGFESAAIKLLPVGVDLSQFRTPTLKPVNKSFQILFVGRLVEFKAPLFTIKIIEELSRHIKNMQLLVVGEGEEYINCENYIKMKGLEDVIKLLGPKSQEDIIDIMAKADIFLYPGIVDRNGRCENQGLVVQEAQAMCLPVVVSNVGGLKEGVINGVTGYIVEEGNKNEFIKRLKYLIENPTVSNRMAIEARDFIKSNYNAKVLVDKLVSIYKNNYA